MTPLLTPFSFWAFLYVQNRHDICMFFFLFLDLTSGRANYCVVPVQNYITAILIFLVVEQAMTWGFYGTFSFYHLNICYTT
jgi:hypothetical protein